VDCWRRHGPEEVPTPDPRMLQRWAPLGQTALSRSGLGANKSDGLWRSSRGHRCSLVRAGLLALLILLVLLLAGQSGLLRAGRNPHSVGPSDSVCCHPNQGHDRLAAPTTWSSCEGPNERAVLRLPPGGPSGQSKRCGRSTVTAQADWSAAGGFMESSSFGVSRSGLSRLATQKRAPFSRLLT
jgi:hypothetical protein